MSDDAQNRFRLSGLSLFLELADGPAMARLFTSGWLEERSSPLGWPSPGNDLPYETASEDSDFDEEDEVVPPVPVLNLVQQLNHDADPANVPADPESLLRDPPAEEEVDVFEQMRRVTFYYDVVEVVVEA